MFSDCSVAGLLRRTSQIAHWSLSALDYYFGMQLSIALNNFMFTNAHFHIRLKRCLNVSLISISILDMKMRVLTLMSPRHIVIVH